MDSDAATATIEGDDLVVGYLGYGSLVNRATLRTDFVGLIPCRIAGYRRGWRHRISRRTGHTQTVLTAIPDAGAVIDGVIVVDRLANLPLVDARERGYDRLTVAPESVTRLAGGFGEGGELFIYVSATPHHAPPGEDHPVPLSYVDAVVAGYLELFGEEGVRRFVETTDAWDVPLLDDRAAPTYPRSIPREEALERLVDTEIARLGFRPALRLTEAGLDRLS